MREERERGRSEEGRKEGRWSYGEVEALTALRVNPSPT